MNHRNILILQTAFLGDVILSTPLLRAVRQLYPAARLDVLTIPETGAVFRHNPHVDEVLFFRKRPFLTKIMSLVRVISRIRKRKYDLAISIQSSLTSSFILLLGGVPRRLGFSRQRFLTDSVPHENGPHKIQKILRLMEPLTDRRHDMQTEIFWGSDEAETCRRIIETVPDDCDRVIGVAPGSIWYTKRWIKEYYRELVALLERERVHAVLIGAKEDVPLCEFIKGDSGATIVAGSVSVPEAAALIERLDLLLTNDSAPLHIANAVKTDVIAIFGPTVRDLGFYPYRDNDEVIEVELDCRPCGTHGAQKCPLGHHDCMNLITPDIVLDEVRKHLRDGSPSRTRK